MKLTDDFSIFKAQPKVDLSINFTMMSREYMHQDKINSIILECERGPAKLTLPKAKEIRNTLVELSRQELLIYFDKLVREIYILFV